MIRLTHYDSYNSLKNNEHIKDPESNCVQVNTTQTAQTNLNP